MADTDPRLASSTTRASWTTAGNAYCAVVKELGTDAWLWTCKHEHLTRAGALACARNEQQAHKRVQAKLGKKR